MANFHLNMVVYDDFNRVTGVVYGTKSENAETATFEDNPRYEYAYNANGQVAHVRNNLIGQIAESEYDLSNRPCRIKTHKFTEDDAGNVTNQEHVYTGEVAYDDIFGRLSKFTEQVGADHEEYGQPTPYKNAGLLLLRPATHLIGFCSMPTLQNQYSNSFQLAKALPGFIAHWCLSQKGRYKNEAFEVTRDGTIRIGSPIAG